VGYTTLGVGGTLYASLQTPNAGRWSHLVWNIASSGILTTTLEEDAAGGMAGGARPTIHANNRNLFCWTGAHTGGNNEAILTDAAQNWRVNELVGYQIFNSTDGSSGFITANTANTVTAVLTGGAGNDWDTNDTYEINRTGMVVTTGVTVYAAYTQRVDDVSFGSKQFGGAIVREDELILKQNSVYCRAFTSATAANIITFKAGWYEHTDRD
jgi:hypothetical protein